MREVYGLDPAHDTAQEWAKVPSQELSDYLVDSLSNKEE